MSGNVCPSCHSPIDPARAPVARVRGTKVVTFCSVACADTADRAVEEIDEARADDDDASEASHVARGADFGYSDDSRVSSPGHRKRRIVALSAAIMAGGMVITIINTISPSSPSNVSAASRVDASHHPTSSVRRPGESGAVGMVIGEPDSPGASEMAEDSAEVASPDTARLQPASPAEAAAVAELAALPADALYTRARDVLVDMLSSPSARVQRIAAMALSRTGDTRAIEHLARLLEQDDNSLVRIDAAYALARVGDARGKKVLLDGLRNQRRDVRGDAARALVQLGDDRGNKTLRRLLSLSTHRLGAAELLARRGDRDGLAALREALASDSSSEEMRMRALVALGRSGDSSVRDKLLAILADGRYLVGAADALATLGDKAAVAPLTEQLGIASLRVRAALALRRLGVEPDFSLIVSALVREGEPARISAAEALLVLAGPKELAELD